MIRILLGSLICGLLLSGCTSPENETSSVAITLRPIHSLAASLLEKTDIKPILIITQNQSPHALSLKPSQARALEQANLIIRVSERLETFTKSFAKQKKGQVISLDRDAGLNLISLKKAGKQDSHKHTMPDGHSHDDGHDHGTDTHMTDPHLWLDSWNMRKAAHYLARIFSWEWPAHKQQIAKNLAALTQQLTEFEKATQAKFQALPKPLPQYIVFHQGYRYFERQFGLKNAGAVRLNVTHSSGTRHQLQLRKKLKEESIACLFSEKQFNPAPLKALVAGTQVKLYQLDPLGTDIKPGPELYLHLMNNISNTFLKCLKSAHPTNGKAQ